MGGGWALAAAREVEEGFGVNERWAGRGVDPERKAVAGVGPAGARRTGA
jgi:hypothetical protein